MASFGSSQFEKYSGSEEDHRVVMEQRKRKRMISNRESARRSRMKKKKQMDELMGVVGKLRSENHHILTNINITNHLYFTIEAENSVLRAQLCELSHRLQSLNEIINSLKGGSNGFLDIHHHQLAYDDDQMMINGDHDFLNPWSSSLLCCVNQPIMASAADMFMY